MELTLDKKECHIKDLKEFFIKRNVSVREAHNLIFKFIDYIERVYPNFEDKDCQFIKNGN